MKEQKNTTNIFWGLILIILGVAFLADQFTVLNFGRIIGFAWPLILVALGVNILIKNSRNKGAYFLIILGLIFFAGNFLPFGIWNLWPLFLIFFGVMALLPGRAKETFNAGTSVSGEEMIQDSVIFWGLEKKINSQNFRGGEVNAIFGGVTLDLRDAKLAEGAKLEVNAIFGGIEVMVAQNMNVVNQGTGVFGGFSNSVRHKPESKETLEITGSAIFGGVDVK